MGYNLDIGANTGAEINGLSSVITPVRVTGIILDERHERWESLGGWDSLGTIFFTGVNETKSGTIPNSNNTARPLFPNLKQYPLLNEIVLIVKATNRNIYGIGKGEDTYYLPSINIWSHQHHNALPTKTSLDESGDSKSNDYKKIEAGAVRQATDGSTDINLGRYFNEQINIKPLLPYEGDYIIEGRYGNSIRFGATVKNDVLSETNINDWSQGDEPIGTPITIIRNGQSSELDEKGWIPTIEDINRDDSSIYMTSNQKISSLVVASTNFQSYESEIESPADPLTSLVDPPLPEVKQPEPASVSQPTDLNQDSTLQDLDDTPPTPEVDSSEEEEETTTQSTDSLSFFDEMTSSGQVDPDDFVEYNFIAENETISGSEIDPEIVDEDHEDTSPNNEGKEKHEQEKKDIKEGRKDTSKYPYTLTNKNGKEVTLQAPKRWNSLKRNIGPKSSKVTKLFIHTTAGNIKGTAVDVMNHFFHGNNWPVGGYHYLIEASGKVTQIYKDDKKLWGVRNQNTGAIHFSWIGGFDFKQGGNQMTKGQADTLVEMIKFYCKRYPDILVYGHNQFAPKECPWFYVPKLMLELGLEDNMGLTDPQWKLKLDALPKFKKVAQQIAQGKFPLNNLTKPKL